MGSSSGVGTWGRGSWVRILGNRVSASESSRTRTPQTSLPSPVWVPRGWRPGQQKGLALGSGNRARALQSRAAPSTWLPVLSRGPWEPGRAPRGVLGRGYHPGLPRATAGGDGAGEAIAPLWTGRSLALWHGWGVLWLTPKREAAPLAPDSPCPLAKRRRLLQMAPPQQRPQTPPAHGTRLPPAPQRGQRLLARPLVCGTWCPGSRGPEPAAPWKLCPPSPPSGAKTWTGSCCAQASSS